MVEKTSFAQKGLVLNSDKTKILVSKYLQSKHLPDKLIGKLCLPGGVLKFGEQPDESFVREVKEETGIVIKPLLPFYVYTWTYKKGDDTMQQIVATVRLGLYESGEILQPGIEEETVLDKSQWLTLDSIDVSQFVHDEQPAIENFIAYRHQNPFLI